MKKEQEGLLDLLKEIDEICREHNIIYYVAGGTVIGAVRHEGFIPWDDDIDLYMTRDNWNKFRDVMKNNPVENRKLECWEDNRGFNNLLGRYMNLNTTQIYKYQLYSDAAMGQLIDIFVLDPIIDDDKAIIQYKKDVMLLADFLNEYTPYSDKLQSCTEYEKIHRNINPTKREKIFLDLLKRLDGYDEDVAGYYILRWGGIPHLFKKEMFQQPKYLKFEDTMVPVPSRVNDYLVQLYGIDWMCIPPHDEKFVHSSLFDYDNSYELYSEEIKSRIDDEKTESLLIDRKKKKYREIQFMHDTDKMLLMKEAEFIREKINIQSKGKNIEDLQEIIDEYIKLQTQKKFIGNSTVAGYYRKENPVFIDIGDDLFAMVLKRMIANDKLSKAHRLLQVRKQCVKRELNLQLKNLESILDGIVEIYSLVEFGKLKEAEATVDSLIKIENNKELWKLKLVLMKERQGDATDEEFENILKSCLEAWGNDGDFNKFKGDESIKHLDFKGAVQYYTIALEKSNNGLFALQIKHRVNEFKDEILEAIKIEAYGNPADAKSILNAWRKLYADDLDFMEIYIEIFACDIEELFESDAIKSFFDNNENIDKRIYGVFHKAFKWTEEETLFILSEMGLIEDTGLYPNRFNQENDVADVLNAIISERKGDVPEAYEQYIKLIDSKDKFVAWYTKRKLFGDNERFKKYKKKGDIDILRSEYMLRYSNFTQQEYQELINSKIYTSQTSNNLMYEEKYHSNVKLSLLKELVRLCNDNSIDYFMGGGILYYVLNPSEAMPVDFHDIELVTDGVNAQKLISACKNLPKDRTLENVLTNPKLRSLDMYYINTESTEIDFNKLDRRRNIGISIPIRVIRPHQNEVIKQKIDAKKDKLWRAGYGYHFITPALTSKEEMIYNLYCAVNGNGDRATKKIFENNLKLETKEDAKRLNIYNTNRIKKHDTKAWTEKYQIEMFGEKIYVPGNVEDYIKKVYGRNYADNIFRYDGKIYDETYVNHDAEEKLYNDELLWRNLKTKMRNLLKYRNLAKEYRKNWKMAKEIVSGISEEKDLLKNMDRLKKIYEKGVYSEVILQMSGYKKVMRAKRKYGLSVNNELERMYLNSLNAISN